MNPNAERTKLLDKITRLEGKTNFETVPKEQYDRAREVVQSLVDAMKRADEQIAHTEPCPWPVVPPEICGCPLGDARRTIDAAFDLAKSQLQIEPTKP
jgi:hypothetical protein